MYVYNTCKTLRPIGIIFNLTTNKISNEFCPKLLCFYIELYYNIS